jgi:hypothetical protein
VTRSMAVSQSWSDGRGRRFDVKGEILHITAMSELHV